MTEILARSAPHDGVLRRISDVLVGKPGLLLLFLLRPPLLWLGVVYLRAARAELVLDRRVRGYDRLKTYAVLLAPANLDIILRTLVIAAVVTVLAALVAFPIAYTRRATRAGRRRPYSTSR
jgi:putative spermidine/putrescine transport system permease protein